ncbi:AmmeMemoRadiSam system radical SAM enzyme [Candidatus Bathyarchaeota archaeon]|nr:AmmeMemoRadiSam system radical SAM enzyme [Candidatus Bathyarchaeota archaeon]MBS7629442.1 AmmeMemoRadiSam system radical SAM enzyme [Candidatus Bathyarchaeota archaeon]
MVDTDRREAMFYTPIDESKVRCELCNHYCTILDGKTGICGVRINEGGRLYSMVYGKVAATGIDPVEKKPLYHFHPGTSTYSISTVGCNFRCRNCQNYEISQMPRDQNRIFGEGLPPEEVVEAAKRYRCESISYTYTEPTIFYEYAYDTARIASREGLKNIFVTNGYISADALKTIKPYLHAANIDLKSFSDSFYRENCGARLQPVLDNIRLHRELGIWVEVTTLIIPTMNDSEDELRSIAGFIKSVGEEIPWHVSQFYPMYRLLDLPRTPVSTLKMARRIGLEAGLRYVYVGNVPGDEGENTYCYNCGERLIRRFGYEILENKIGDSRCPKCGAEIDGVEI